MSRFRLPAQRILDFDIETRPLAYLGKDFTTGEPTAIAASFGPFDEVHVWHLGMHEPAEMLEGFRKLYNQAGIVTGHNIRKFDLPVLNGAMLDNNLPPLGPKLTSDTYLDLIKTWQISRSQESLAGMLGCESPKIRMTQADWRSANRLERTGKTRNRAVGDVRQHQELRARLLDLGALAAPVWWSGVPRGL